MARTSKKKSKAGAAGGFSIFDDTDTAEVDGDEDLPKDEAGRQKIKQQYVDLLGIRIQKLRGRILNRERINKTLEGIYFICARCAKVCHNLDEGLVEDERNERNLCVQCSQAGATALEEFTAKRAERAARSKAAKKTARTAKTQRKTAAKPPSAAKARRKK